MPLQVILCGTGHRPNKLGGYGEDVAHNLRIVAGNWLERYGPEKVISGMALGWDQQLALAAIALNIPVIAAVPFSGQEKAWPLASQEVFHFIIDKAADVEVVSAGGYAPWKMQVRNQWMVDNAKIVLALWDGSDGGTANCIRYAESKNKPITNLWEFYEEQKRISGRDQGS